MSFDVLDALRALLNDTTRLYRLHGDGPLAHLLAEAWSEHEALDQPWAMSVSALSADARLDPQAMLGRKLTLFTRLADGSEHPRSGIVTQASAEDADGGFARYRLRVEAWVGLMAHQVRSQVWQEQRVTDIVESVFAAYPQAAWRWADDVAPFLADSANAGVRSYTVQYRETDLAFVQRLLAQEGISWRLEHSGDAAAGHTLVLLADTASAAACPEDAVSAGTLGGSGVRYHGSSSQEAQDSIQAFGGRRRLPVAQTTVLAWDYKAKRAVATSVPTAAAYAGANAPALEDYDDSCAYAYADTAQAERAARLMQQAIEACHKTWLGRSTVRTFTAGTFFRLTQSDLDALDALGQGEDDRRFLLTAVTHAGINNLPKDFSNRIADTLGDALQAEGIGDELRAQAARTGYGNAFEAIRAKVPWRPQLQDDTGARRHTRPTAQGMLTATVVGAQGQTQANGADELHMDRLGRVRIRFDFQTQTQTQGPNTSPTSTWVRVMQRWAGAGMGAQFVPRIGQEVLVDFVGGNIERPLVVGALYNGKGQGGTPATPGGQAANADAKALAQSTDHRPGAQGNLSGGHAPAWHGAGAATLESGGQRNAAALSGTKTQEFGGTGFNQLVFDDSNGQLRTQLATTQHATQLNLGHLIHQADNHRGSFRGLGFELRSDAYGALRAGQGVLISSFGTQPSEAAGDNAAGIALQGQFKTLVASFSQAAGTHQTVKLAGQIGSVRAGQSALNDKEAPAQALHTTLKGMVSDAAFDAAQSDAGTRSTATGADKLPYASDPIIAIAAKAGLATVAGQDVQWSAGETIAIGSGQSTHIASGGASRIHSGQAIGMLAGAVKPGEQAQGKGLTLIAGQGDIEVQAQADTMQVAAQKDVSIQSQSAHIDWAAAKKIVLATAGGASVTIEGGNITVECPGKILVQASQKSFVGPEKVDVSVPSFPTSEMVPQLRFALQSHAGSGVGHVFAFEPYKLFAGGALIEQGLTSADGEIKFKHKVGVTDYKVELVNGQVFEIAAQPDFSEGAAGEIQRLANAGYRDEPASRRAPGVFRSERDQRASVEATERGLDAHKSS